MGICIQYGDTITIVSTTPDEYGTESIDEMADIPAVVNLNTGYSHGGHQDAVTSDATVFVPPTDAFVVSNFNRLEEMLIAIDLFGTPADKAWYKVVRVSVYRDTQLCNEIDNIELQLKKTAPLEDVS